MKPVCPRCLAEQALTRMRMTYEWRPEPDVNPLAHACGFAEGYFELLRTRPFAVCELHQGVAGNSPAAAKVR